MRSAIAMVLVSGQRRDDRWRSAESQAFTPTPFRIRRDAEDGRRAMDEVVRGVRILSGDTTLQTGRERGQLIE